MVSIDRTIDFQALRVFVEVARRGGFTAAAEPLGMAKSAVSKQLSQLEAALQVRLFERSSRRVALTKEGATLVVRAESILAEVERLALDAAQIKTQYGGTVRIAASPEFGSFLVGKFLPQLLSRHPQLKVLMRLEYQFDDLHDPTTDLAIRLGSVGDDRLVGQRIGELNRVIVCSPAYAQTRPMQRPDDLASADGLMFSDRELSAEWALERRDDPTNTHKVKLHGRLGVRGFSALLAAAEAGLGVACLSEFVAAPALARGTLIQPLPAWKARPASVYLVYRSGVLRIGRVRAVIDAALRDVPQLLAELGRSA
jgi:DNA-binding transcriptional LysR family regulator